MFFKCFLAACVLCLADLSLEGRIVETRNFEEVLPLIDNATWFLVDLDNCMFEGAQALGHAKWFSDQFRQRRQQGMSFEEAINDLYPLWIKTQKVCRVKPLEENFITGLLKLQERGILIMGFTHRAPSVASSTVRQVNSLGFDFSKTAPHVEDFIIQDNHPMEYYKGILFISDFHKKSEAFALFISKVGQKPKKIVFIDDKRNNLEDMEIFSEEGIEYIGVHYTATEHVKPVYVREIAEFQARFLDQIMSNDAALLLMEHGLD